MHKRELDGHNAEIRDHPACLMHHHRGVGGGFVAKEAVSKASCDKRPPNPYLPGLVSFGMQVNFAGSGNMVEQRCSLRNPFSGNRFRRWDASSVRIIDVIY